MAAGRNTKQRAAILRALERAPGFRSAQELHEEMRGAGDRIGLTTVYRNLQALSSAGDIDTLRAPDGESLYRRCEAAHHHHHLVCRGCGHAVAIDNPDLERWTQEVGKRHGFADLTHEVEVFGTCSDCR